MRRVTIALIGIFAFAAFALALSPAFITTPALATSGACSGHDGVDCAAGPDTDGSVICNDTWPNSSVMYTDMVMCEGYTIPDTTLSPAAPEPTPATSTSTSFTDVPTSYKYEQAVEYVKSAGIVEGYTDGTYKPDAKINRAEFTKILIAWKFPNEPLTGQNCFTDVASEWFAPYVCLAKTKGIIGGYSDGTFRPDQNISVPEALKIVLLANGSPVAEVPGDWHQKYVTYAQSNGLLLPEWTDMTYTITRGEMAEVVRRVGVKKIIFP